MNPFSLPVVDFGGIIREVFAAVAAKARESDGIRPELPRDIVPLLDRPRPSWAAMVSRYADAHREHRLKRELGSQHVRKLSSFPTLVWRVEDAKGHGPYAPMCRAIARHTRRHRHVHWVEPDSDSVLDCDPQDFRSATGLLMAPHAGFHGHFGFPSPAALRTWFNFRSLRDAMSADGFTVGVYEVPAGLAMHGETQSIFAKAASRCVERLSLVNMRPVMGPET